MGTQITILDSPETLPLSAEAQAALGLHAGSRISITIEQGRVILQSLEEDDLDRLAGSLSSNPSMADELQQERREDDDLDQLADSRSSSVLTAEEPQPRRRLSEADTRRILDELRGMFRGQPSLEDEYFATRDIDKW